ncbi:MAG TPA: nucleoside triphosphate pyrophosphohydrolase [Candidatus Udaeobacter sp.]|jgi:MazG family protein|nr:nucleoside triphosphate pyrophosphohydrolase [Candidatus Udaeobacter sp.]
MTAFEKLCEIVAKLRAPGGCPWDREQTHESLLPALIEEAYEVAGAVRANDTANFREELGDLLLLIVMHAQIASESSRFDINAVLKDVTEKLIRRHPHVFGNSDARDSGAVLKQWESIKRAEKKHNPVRNAGDAAGHYLDDLSLAFPALMRAQKTQSKVARVNFDWTELGDVIAKVEEEIQELKLAIAKWHRHPADASRAASPCHEVEDETGDLLFAVVNLARKCKLDAESALQGATDKFVARFNRLEDELQLRGKKLGDVDLAEMDKIWNQIKETPNAEPPTPSAEAF